MLNKSVPGFKIINVPIKPIDIATILWNPIFSDRIGIANIDAIIGAVWKIAWFSDNNKNLIPKKNKTTQKEEEKALIKWAIGFLVFIVAFPKIIIRKIDKINPLNARKKLFPK